MAAGVNRVFREMMDVESYQSSKFAYWSTLEPTATTVWPPRRIANKVVQEYFILKDGLDEVSKLESLVWGVL